jgi:hypothetical protein
MLKVFLAGFVLPLVLFFAPADVQSGKKISVTNDDRSDILQKMIVASGTATMHLDLKRLNVESAGGVSELRFAVAPNSFFPILVFNDLLRAAAQGSMGLIPQNRPAVPAALAASLNQLVIEKLPSSEQFDLVLRDERSGFVFFNIVGHLYDYDAPEQSLTIRDGRLLISKEFAQALGRSSDEGMFAGTIAVRTSMEAIGIAELVNGEAKSVAMPPLKGAAGPNAPTLVPGPDVIVGDLPDMEQFGSSGTQVGLGIATTSCNNGTEPLNWFALPNTDHPVIPQNLYRMSGGADNTERFEQIGQSWLKHAFAALEDNACGFGCNTNGCSQGVQLCSGCSDPYDASLNANQFQIGSRAWVNPFTGAFQSNADDHTGHNHDGVSHRVRVNVDDLNTNLNPGATYFAEAQYVTPHEYAWCQAHPGECNMYKNASYRQFSVSGTTNFTFSPLGPTMRMQPAIVAWTGATINLYQPDPGNDGIFFVGYKVTNPSPGTWHYEYAIYNQNLDRAIQSFEVTFPAFPPAQFNVGFHAPPQEPSWANDGTFNNQGYSSHPWSFIDNGFSVTWSCETFAQNPNANAIRWGTLYNFSFDTLAAPAASTANIRFFKTGAPIFVPIQAPNMSDQTPTPTPSSTPTATATATATPTSTPPFGTPTPPPTATPPRSTPIPRARPSPRPRPTPG